VADLALPFDRGTSPSDKRACPSLVRLFCASQRLPEFSLAAFLTLRSYWRRPHQFADPHLCLAARLLPCLGLLGLVRRGESMVSGQHHAIIVHHGTAVFQAFSQSRAFFLEIFFKRLIGHGSLNLPRRLRIQTRSRRRGFSAHRNQATIGCPPPQIRAIALSRARGVNGFRRMSTSSGRSLTASDSA
jgi:hypothetical protein